MRCDHVRLDRGRVSMPAIRPFSVARSFSAKFVTGVAVGAHPGFPDLAGFGRRELQVVPGGGPRISCCIRSPRSPAWRRRGHELQHVKPHGALFNMAVRDPALAAAIARAVAVFRIRSLILFGSARIRDHQRRPCRRSSRRRRGLRRPRL
jgi:UPF0271 protein